MGSLSETKDGIVVDERSASSSDSDKTIDEEASMSEDEGFQREVERRTTAKHPKKGSGDDSNSSRNDSVNSDEKLKKRIFEQFIKKDDVYTSAKVAGSPINFNLPKSDTVKENKEKKTRKKRSNTSSFVSVESQNIP